jgi:NAD(P)-dependent dehydrogenase (short-subunit alcohol dehydrogenase family)
MVSSPASSRPQRPVALVTGAARRMGRHIAQHLAQNGWEVVVHARAASVADAQGTLELVRAAGASGWLLQADLADEAACQALVPQAVAAAGRLDAVVNNASLFEYDDVAAFSTAAMDAHWRSNTAPAVILSRSLHAHLVARQAKGCVVNLLDQKLANPNPDYFSYTLSKAALAEATVMLAQALAPTLRVCGVSPGVTLVSGPMTEAEFDAARRLTPLQHSSTPEDIAQAVHFLLQAPAITGHTLLVDGGQHLMGQPRDVLFLAQQQAATASPASKDL